MSPIKMNTRGTGLELSAEQETIGSLCNKIELLDSALRNACNTLYALRDHAIEQGLSATVEQQAIDRITFIRAQVKG